MDSTKEKPLDVRIDRAGEEKTVVISQERWDDASKTWKRYEFGCTAKGELATLSDEALVNRFLQELFSSVFGDGAALKPKRFANA